MANKTVVITATALVKMRKVIEDVPDDEVADLQASAELQGDQLNLDDIHPDVGILEIVETTLEVRE